MTNLNELSRLENWLKAHAAAYDWEIQRRDRVPANWFQTEFHQIMVRSSKGEYLFDAVCQPGTYGYDVGLLETMGSIVDEEVGDDVEGYLSANDVIDRITAVYGQPA